MKTRVLLTSLALGLITVINVAAATPSKPNIVFIIADDLGWADVAFHGGHAPTPNLDRLARTGLELTQHYSAATCSPTRAALMSGRYWSRFGLLGPDNRRAFAWDTMTLPRALKTLGYETALTGKWHLGSRPSEGPNHFGFDHSYGSLAGGVGPYDHFYKEGEFSRTWHRNEKLITETGHVTDLITREAVSWIAGRKDAPFFLYVPYTAVHLPLKEPKEWLDRVPASITDEVARHYAACIMHLDDAVGQIVVALEKAGKRENTLLVFTSDNGGSWAQNANQPYPPDDYPQGKIPGNNVPLRGQKGDLYEGGIHTPAVVSWPGRIQPDKNATPFHVVDWMPTLCALAGYTPERDLKWDGMNMWPHLAAKSGGVASAPRLLYWATPQGKAVRDGDLKLIVHSARNTTATKSELFDLAKDPYETTDLAAKMPKQVANLTQKLALVSKADNDARVKN
jgi:arylsulfatase A-like enzyme